MKKEDIATEKSAIEIWLRDFSTWQNVSAKLEKHNPGGNSIVSINGQEEATCQYSWLRNELTVSTENAVYALNEWEGYFIFPKN